MGKWRDVSRTLAGQMDDYAALAKQGRVKLGLAPMQVRPLPLASPSPTPPWLRTSPPGRSPSQVKDFEPLLGMSGKEVPAVQRLVRLMAERAMAVPSEVVVVAGGGAHGVAAAAGGKREGRRREEEEEEDEEEDDEENDEEEEDEEEEEEEEDEGGNEDDEDKIGQFHWSDDDE